MVERNVLILSAASVSNYLAVLWNISEVKCCCRERLQMFNSLHWPQFFLCSTLFHLNTQTDHDNLDRRLIHVVQLELKVFLIFLYSLNYHLDEIRMLSVSTHHIFLFLSLISLLNYCFIVLYHFTGIRKITKFNWEITLVITSKLANQSRDKFKYSILSSLPNFN